MSVPLAALLAALRTRLDAITVTPSLPAARAWANASYTPAVGTPYLSDDLVAADTRYAALGAGAPKRTKALYRIRVHVPRHTSATPALTWAGAIAGAMLAPDLLVGTSPVEVDEARVEGDVGDDAWYVVPVSVFLWFGHP